MTSWQPNFNKTIVWGNCKQTSEIDYGPMLRPSAPRHRRIIMQRPTKIVKPTNVSFLNILPLDILADIDN